MNIYISYKREKNAHFSRNATFYLWCQTLNSEFILNYNSSSFSIIFFAQKMKQVAIENVTRAEILRILIILPQKRIIIFEAGVSCFDPFSAISSVTFLILSFPPLLPVLEVLPLDGEGALFIFANLRLPPEDSHDTPATGQLSLQKMILRVSYHTSYVCG